MGTNELRLPVLLPWQVKAWNDPARFKIVRCGRRAGKTRLAHFWSTAQAISGKVGWWVAPSFPLTQVAERLMDFQVANLRRAGMPIKVDRVDRLYTFPSGGWLQIRSAADPDALVSEGLDFVVMDEASRIQERAWNISIRPALMDRKGSAWFPSTPFGRNWFFNLWQAGLDDPQWGLHHYTSYDNPNIDRREIDHLRDTLPEKIFQQEVMAEFVDLEGVVFRRLREAVYQTLPDKFVADDVVVGVDWGKVNDFTAFTALEARKGYVLEVDRSNKIDYTIQQSRLAAFCKRHNSRLVIAEENSMGGPIIEALRRSGLRVHPVTTTAVSKPAMIESLALAFEQGTVHIPEAAGHLFNELMAYEAKRSTTGRIKYGAPDGLHDDCVMSLALAWTHARIGRPMSAYKPQIEHLDDPSLMGG